MKKSEFSEEKRGENEIGVFLMKNKEKNAEKSWKFDFFPANKSRNFD